jgi:alkaline phosphatase D
MSPVAAPDLSQTPPQLVVALEHVRPGAAQLLKLTRFPFPLNTDAWDGYPTARARVLASFRRNEGNAIVLAGDSHAAWANELDDAQGRVAVEFGATSITSPGFGDYFVRGGMDFGALVRARNPQIKWTNQRSHGFILLTLTHQQAKAEFFKVSTIESKQYQTTLDASFTVAPSSGAGIGAITPAHT